MINLCSNNTNKLSPQELMFFMCPPKVSSNNTNKLSPQELDWFLAFLPPGSNNTNKLSPQERNGLNPASIIVQIIQINLVLKNFWLYRFLIA